MSRNDAQVLQCSCMAFIHSVVSSVCFDPGNRKQFTIKFSGMSNLLGFIYCYHNVGDHAFKASSMVIYVSLVFFLHESFTILCRCGLDLCEWQNS